MTDLLTTEESEQAAQQGWQLCYVFDQDRSRWIVEVLPTAEHRVKSARFMQTVVLNLARSKDPVALRAMALVMKSHTPEKTKRTKK